MKPLSETFKELGIAFVFPIEIKGSEGKKTYFEDSDGYWSRSEYNSKGNETYFEDSKGYWSKREYDSNGKTTYYENSDGYKTGTPRSQTFDGKVVEIDGIKYELKLKN